MNLCKVAIVLISGVIVSCGDGKASQRSERGCTLVVAVAPDDTPTLQGDCPRDGKHVAAAISRAANSLKAGDELALGRTPFGPDGVFNYCAIAARLAADPRWAASIDSRQAVAPLRDALQSVSLAPAVTERSRRQGLSYAASAWKRCCCRMARHEAAQPVPSRYRRRRSYGCRWNDVRCIVRIARSGTGEMRSGLRSTSIPDMKRVSFERSGIAMKPLRSPPVLTARCG